MHKHHGASVTKMKIATLSESPNARYVLAMQDVSTPTSHLIKLALGRARLQSMKMRKTHECVHHRESVHHRGSVYPPWKSGPSGPRKFHKISVGFSVCVRTGFRATGWDGAPQNPAPEGRPTLAQRFSAGDSGTHDSSPGGTTEFSRTLFSPVVVLPWPHPKEIGRASCRERV